MRGKIRSLAAVASLLTAGCATWGQFDEGMDTLLNRPLSEAVAKLGYPSGERMIVGKRLVYWGRSRNDVLLMPTATTTYGTVTTGRTLGNYSATSMGSTMVPVSYSCSITLEVDKDEIVRHYAYEGNLGGCATYITALKAK